MHLFGVGDSTKTVLHLSEQEKKEAASTRWKESSSFGDDDELARKPRRSVSMPATTGVTRKASRRTRGRPGTRQHAKETQAEHDERMRVLRDEQTFARISERKRAALRALFDVRTRSVRFRRSPLPPALLDIPPTARH